jgi:amino acid adenylation domain-containing protein
MNTQSLESDSTIPAFFERAAPVTEPQREIWLACQMGDDASLAYNEAVAIDLVGALDVSALERAVLAVVQRHDSLRSVFAADGSEIQVFPEPAAGAFRQSDGTKDAGLAESIQRTAVTTPFDLESGPLFYAHLVRVAADQHRLFLVAHHIVCDGWSTGKIVAEIARHYSADVSGAAIRAGEADAFCDYADHLLSADSVARGQDALSFWLKQYEHDAPVLELPADVRRTRNRGFQSERIDLVIDGQTLRLLEEVCRREAASVFAGVVTAFTAWLGRISGADDVAVAVPRAGQLDDGRPSLVGHCVRTLPLRLAAEQGATFADLLARNQEAVIEAFDHSALTYGSLLRSLALPRDPARLPLVNVMFNLDQELSAESMEFHGLTAEMSTVPRVAENFEIFVNAVRFAGGLRVECQYAAWLFSPTHAGALLASFVEFVGELVRHADRPIGALSIVSPGVFATLSGWQARPVATPSPGNLADYVLRHAARLGGKRAIISGGEILSYDDLAHLSAAIAQRLLAAGLRPGDYVGVALDRSPRMVAAMLGVLKAGGAYLPLDPGYPTERLQFMVEDAGLQLLICDPDGAARVAMPDLRVLSLASADADALLTEKAAAVSTRVAPESPAYVIYTSGSTGRPKGVAVPHESVRNFLESMAQSPGLGEADVLVAVTTLSFDISVLELFLPLSVGGTVAIASRDQAMDGVALAQLPGNCAATAMQATPEMWRLLLRSGWSGSRSFKVLCGGEALPPDLATELLPCCGELWNLYGPTETTVWSTCELVRDPQAITVGRPIQNTTVWMLNAQGQLCPPGVAGEICIGGRGVALGYLKRP